MRSCFKSGVNGIRVVHLSSDLRRGNKIKQQFIYNACMYLGKRKKENNP